MNPKDRDELLARLDERSRNTWHMVEKMEAHQVVQNGLLLETCKRSISNAVWIKTFRWVGTLFVAGVSAWMSKLQGWW